MPTPLATSSAVVSSVSRSGLELSHELGHTLTGHRVGVLVAEGTNAALLRQLCRATADAGAMLSVVAQHEGALRLSDNSLLAADLRLADCGSADFDAVAVILSSDGHQALRHDPKVIDFVRDACAHLKAIAVDSGGMGLLHHARVAADAGLVDARNIEAFLTAAKVRVWDRVN